MANRKEQHEHELNLFHTFKKSPTPETFQPLYESFKPLIVDAAKPNVVGSPLPRAAHMAYAAQNFYDSLRTYDPSKGSLRTHVFNSVREKGKRLNYKYQNIGYIPEARAPKYGQVTNAMAMLRSTLGREPSAVEIADELHISVKNVETFLKEMRKGLLQDEILSKAAPVYKSDKVKQLAMDIQYSLIPAHQVVLEHVFGLNGKPELIKPNGSADKQAIAKKTNLSTAQVNSAFKTISRKMRQYTGEVSLAEESEAEED